MSSQDPGDRALALAVGRNLIRLRRAADMTQGELGNLAGLHATAIGLIERGERGTRTDTLVKLAGALEVGPADLLQGIVWRPAPPPPRPGGFVVSDDPEDQSGR